MTTEHRLKDTLLNVSKASMSSKEQPQNAPIKPIEDICIHKAHLSASNSSNITGEMRQPLPPPPPSRSILDVELKKRSQEKIKINTRATIHRLNKEFVAPEHKESEEEKARRLIIETRASKHRHRATFKPTKKE